MVILIYYIINKRKVSFLFLVCCYNEWKKEVLMKKICLVYPKCYEVAKFGNKRKELPPFGVMYLASALEKENYDVEIVPTSNDVLFFKISW